MEDNFSSKFFSSLFSALIATAITGVIIYVIFSENEPLPWVIIISVLVFTISFYTNLKNKVVEIYEAGNKKIEEYNNLIEESDKKLTMYENEKNVFKQSLVEKSSGFPTLHSSIDEFEKYYDDFLSKELILKSHPAYTSAEVVREQSRRRREAEKKQRITQSIIEFYENLEPSLIEYKNEEFGNMDEILKEWSEEEKQDPVSFFLSKEEYRSLSVSEKNQLALERYWKRPHSKWYIGIMYERYVGYLYEMDGYDVNYTGIKEGKGDLGRDVIAQKGNNFIVIQCKYWSQFRTIYEKHIFQFFGTVFQYKHANKKKKVRGIFYSTTTVSDLAKSFANELGIELKENYKMDRGYPCIKCNISKVGGTRIYHLPFDQQYDNVKIEKNKGEFYCASVKEAEEKGFRRAWRWKG